MPSHDKWAMNRQAGVGIKQFSALFKSTSLSLHSVMHSLKIHCPSEFFQLLIGKLYCTVKAVISCYFLFFFYVHFLGGDKYSPRQVTDKPETLDVPHTQFKFKQQTETWQYSAAKPHINKPKYFQRAWRSAGSVVTNQNRQGRDH